MLMSEFLVGSFLLQVLEQREQQAKETEEYAVQERERLNDFEAALKIREESLSEQKLELVSHSHLCMCVVLETFCQMTKFH